MSRLAERAREERRVFIQEAAARLGTLPVIVEKDYWVCWLLGKIFADPRWEHHLVFKGGTSLSKVMEATCRRGVTGSSRPPEASRAIQVAVFWVIMGRTTMRLNREAFDSSRPHTVKPKLRQDYATMEPMFLARPPAFEEVVETLLEAEAQINALDANQGTRSV